MDTRMHDKEAQVGFCSSFVALQVETRTPEPRHEAKTHEYAHVLQQKYSHFSLVKTHCVLKVRLICHSVTSRRHRDNRHPAGFRFVT